MKIIIFLNFLCFTLSSFCETASEAKKEKEAGNASPIAAQKSEEATKVPAKELQPAIKPSVMPANEPKKHEEEAKKLPVKKLAPATDAKKLEEEAKKKAQEAKELSQLADDIQKRYNETRSAILEFEQRYTSAFLSQNEVSKGKVWYKARNMLWRYEEPKDRQKEFYIEGKKFTYHIINDKLAFTHDCFEKDTLSASISFLWGQGKLKESFTIHPLKETLTNTSLKWLTLIPKEKNAPISSISLGVDPKTAVVQESIVTDLSGGKNSFRFSKFVANPVIPEKIFHFVPPAGLKVQPMPNVVCPKAPPPSKAPSPPKAKK